MAKLPKVQAGYIPALYVAKEGTSCGTCRDYIQLTSECVITQPAPVSGPNGTCCLYVKGRPLMYGQPRYLIPKAVVGYIEGAEVPTSCGRCKHYENPGSALSTCEGVGDSDSDTVQAGGCCNLYEIRTKEKDK